MPDVTQFNPDTIHQNPSGEYQNQMKRFIGFRPHPPAEYYEQGAANRPDEPQYEGVVFSDGTVAVRWLTENPSHSIWPDFATFHQIHGHPEYGTGIKWLDE